MAEIVALADRALTAIQLGETHFREFKSALHGPPGQKRSRELKEVCADIAETLVAFANADGGELLVGVEDSGEVTGVDAFSATELQVMANAPSASVHKDTPLNVKPLAVTSAKRSAALPDVPALAETLPGYEFLTWAGYVAPAGTSKEIVGRLHKEFARALAQPDVKARLVGVGQDAAVSESPEEFGRFIRTELAKFERAIKSAGIKVQ